MPTLNKEGHLLFTGARKVVLHRMLHKKRAQEENKKPSEIKAESGSLSSLMEKPAIIKSLSNMLESKPKELKVADATIPEISHLFEQKEENNSTPSPPPIQLSSHRGGHPYKVRRAKSIPKVVNLANDIVKRIAAVPEKAIEKIIEKVEKKEDEQQEIAPIHFDITNVSPPPTPAPVTKLTGQPKEEPEKPITTTALPLAKLLDSSRAERLKEELKPSQKEGPPLSKKKEEPKKENPTPPTPYIDSSTFNRQLVYRSDLQMIDETLSDGNWWTYKAISEKTGITVPSLHQIMVRLKKALPGIMVKDLKSDGPPIKSHPVRIKIPDHILPQLKSVLTYERPKFNPQMNRRRAHSSGAEAELFGDSPIHKLNNVETSTSIGDAFEPIDESELSGTDTDPDIEEEEKRMGIRTEDVKASTLNKIIGDMSLDEVRRAINSYRLRQNQRVGGGSNLSQVLEEELLKQRLRGGDGSSVPSFGNRLKESILDGLEAQILMRMIGPSMSIMEPNKGGEEKTGDIEKTLNLLLLLDKVGGGKGNQTDTDKLLQLFTLLQKVNEPNATKSTGPDFQKSIDDLRTTITSVIEDKSNRGREIELLNEKLDNLIRDREKKETTEEFQERIDDIKETVGRLIEEQKGNKTDPIATFFQLQTELGKSRNEADAKIELLRTEIEKEKNEAIKTQLQELQRQISQIGVGKPEDETVKNIRGAVTEIITNNLKKVSQLGETTADIENKKLEQLKGIIEPVVTTMRETVLKPVGEGIGKGVEESIKRQMNQPQQTVAQAQANLAQAQAAQAAQMQKDATLRTTAPVPPTPKSQFDEANKTVPTAGMTPEEKKKKEVQPYFMP